MNQVTKAEFPAALVIRLSPAHWRTLRQAQYLATNAYGAELTAEQLARMYILKSAKLFVKSQQLNVIETYNGGVWGDGT